MRLEGDRRVDVGLLMVDAPVAKLGERIVCPVTAQRT